MRASLQSQISHPKREATVFPLLFRGEETRGGTDRDHCGGPRTQTLSSRSGVVHECRSHAPGVVQECRSATHVESRVPGSRSGEEVPGSSERRSKPDTRVTGVTVHSCRWKDPSSPLGPRPPKGCPRQSPTGVSVSGTPDTRPNPTTYTPDPEEVFE